MSNTNPTKNRRGIRMHWNGSSSYYTSGTHCVTAKWRQQYLIWCLSMPWYNSRYIMHCTCALLDQLWSSFLSSSFIYTRPWYTYIWKVILKYLCYFFTYSFFREKKMNLTLMDFLYCRLLVMLLNIDTLLQFMIFLVKGK